LAPQGLDYIVAFLGAIQAGQIAVPLSVPLGGVSDERVSSVLRDASRLAATQINAMGGILDGKRLQLVEADDQTNPQAAVTAASRLVDVENVAALVGPLSSSAVLAAAGAVAIPRRIVMISPSATNLDLRPAGQRLRLPHRGARQPAGQVLAREVRRAISPACGARGQQRLRHRPAQVSARSSSGGRMLPMPRPSRRTARPHRGSWPRPRTNPRRWC
jgi:hypothetical protein